MTLTITLKSAKAHHACKDGYTLMHEALGPGWELDAPFPLVRVLEVRGLQDTLWATRCVPRLQGDEKRRILSLWLADVLERVEGKMRDERSRAIIPLLREHAVTPVSAERWRTARAAISTAVTHADYAAISTAVTHAAYDAYDAAAAAYAAAAYAAAAEQSWQVERLHYYLVSGQKGDA